MSARPDPQLLIGRVLSGRFRLDAVRGTGGTGVVYAATDLATRERVAIKLLDEELLRRAPEAKKRLLHEAKVATTVRHPGLADLRHVGTTKEGASYLVFELLTGVSLEEGVRARAIDPIALARLMMQVLDALEAVHSAGFVHRDVKPANIFLVAGTSTVKLLDFGAVKIFEQGLGERLTQNGELVGTVQYMSPEQVLSGPITPRTDIWAVGAVLFRGITGKLPFAGPTPVDVLSRIVGERALPLSDAGLPIPNAYAQVVDRALEPLPKDRWETAEEMKSALRAAVEVTVASKGPPRMRSIKYERPASHV
jgi:eukaryotic-like serine/threonine-protein kinase